MRHEPHRFDQGEIDAVHSVHRILRVFGIRTVREVAINTHHHDYQGKTVRYLKNLRATYGIMMLERMEEKADTVLEVKCFF